MMWSGKGDPPREEEEGVGGDPAKDLREQDELEAALGNGEASPAGAIHGKTYRCLPRPSLSPPLLSLATYQIRFEAAALKEIMFPDSVCFSHGARGSKTMKRSGPSTCSAALATSRWAGGRRHLRSGRLLKSCRWTIPGLVSPTFVCSNRRTPKDWSTTATPWPSDIANRLRMPTARPSLVSTLKTH